MRLATKTASPITENICFVEIFLQIDTQVLLQCETNWYSTVNHLASLGWTKLICPACVVVAGWSEKRVQQMCPKLTIRTQGEHDPV